MEKTGSFSNCVTTNNGKAYGRGNVGKHIWSENLRDIDAYHGGKLIFEQEIKNISISGSYRRTT